MKNEEQNSVSDARLALGVEGFTQEPAYVILHLVGINKAGDLEITQYSKPFWDHSNPPEPAPIPLKQATAVMDAMVGDIQSGRLKPDEITDFEALLWHHVAYIGFIATNDGWTFRGSDGSGKEAVIFEVNTHSFFDGYHAKIGGLPAYFFINHMKDKYGNDLGKCRDPFKYSMYFDVPVITVPPSNPPKTLTVIVDPGGDNMGPRGRP